jgi:hypothetical protein
MRSKLPVISGKHETLGLLGGNLHIKLMAASKRKKPNFVVVRLAGTDRQIQDLHLAIYLGLSGYPPLNKHLTKRDDNPKRWVITGSELTRLSTDELIELLKLAYERRGPR